MIVATVGMLVTRRRRLLPVFLVVEERLTGLSFPPGVRRNGTSSLATSLARRTSHGQLASTSPLGRACVNHPEYHLKPTERFRRTVPAALLLCGLQGGLLFCSSFTALPERLGDCAALTTLKLSSNYVIPALPERLGDCAALATLDLPYCQAINALSERLGNCAALTTLDSACCEGTRRASPH